MEKLLNNYISLSSKDVSGAGSAVFLYEQNESERRRILFLHMKNGVHIPCLDGVQISPQAKIGKNSVILAGTILKGEVTIGEGCLVGPNSFIEDCIIGKSCIIEFSYCEGSSIKDGVSVGPFAHIRPNSVLENETHLGNFTEVKNSRIGQGSKISHLSYVGDADVGKSVNIGCGVVTVNYDGKNKHPTTIGDHAFIGCNTSLIAPVKLGDFAYTAAGSSITDDVPSCALAIARARQVNKENWVRQKKPYKNNNPD